MKSQGMLPRLVLGDLPAPLARPSRPWPRILLCGAFWRLQAMVALIVLFDWAVEQLLEHNQPYEHLHHIAPILYAFPVMFGVRQFGRKGALLITLSAASSSLAYLSLHQGSEECVLIELVQLSIGVALGLFLAYLLEHEARGRQQAQELTARLTTLHKKVIDAQEEERRRIARELHDVTVQSLILLCQRLDRAIDSGPAPRAAVEPLSELRGMADEMLTDVRHLCRELRPSILDDLGLVPAARWLATELTRRRGLAASVEVEGAERRLSPEVELSLFRIVQEALRNVEKHAEATRAIVRLAFEDGLVRLSVQDNGKGFEQPGSPCALVLQGKLGLVGMQERAQFVEGTFEVQTASYKGTRIRVTVAG